MVTRQLSKEDMVMILREHDVSPSDAGWVVEQIERILYITAGGQPVLILSVPDDIRYEDLKMLGSQFAIHRIPVVFIPSSIPVVVEGAVTVSSWLPNLKKKFIEIARRMKREINA